MTAKRAVAVVPEYTDRPEMGFSDCHHDGSTYGLDDAERGSTFGETD